MQAPVLLALLLLMAAPRGSVGQNLLTQVMGKVWDVVFRSFAEASGYKVTALPAPPPKKKAEEKSAPPPVVHHRSFHTTTERVVTMTETFTSSDDDISAPHPQPPFNFYSGEEHMSNWPEKEEKAEDGGHHHSDDDDDEHHQKPQEEEPEESKRMKIKPVKVTKRIKSQRSGSEEKVSFRHIDKQGPKKGAKREPLVIKLLTPTPTKGPSLDDSWPSVWNGAH